MRYVFEVSFESGENLSESELDNLYFALYAQVDDLSAVSEIEVKRVTQ